MENPIPEQRQYSLEEVLSITFNIIKKHWLKFLLICAAIYAPLLLIANLIDTSWLIKIIPAEIMDSLSTSFSAFGSGMNIQETLNTLIKMYYFGVGVIFFGFIINFGIAKIVESCSKAEEPSVKAAFSAAFKKYFIGLASVIIFGIIMFFLSLPFFIPAFIFIIYWMFFYNAIILRNRLGRKF